MSRHNTSAAYLKRRAIIGAAAVAFVAVIVLPAGHAARTAPAAALTGADSRAAGKPSPWLVVLGAPGVERTALVGAIDPKGLVPHLSINRMMRSEMADQTGFGNRISGALKRGVPVSDEVVLKLLGRRLSLHDCDKGVVLEDFPHTLSQAKGLAVILEEQGKGRVTAVHVVVPDETLVARMLEKANGNEKDIRKRVAAYRGRIDPIVEYYRDNGLLVIVEGDQPLEAVSAKIAKELKGWAKRGREDGN
ncbi:MAG: nucleoside monophosphate kinase [Candidatus Krumholzibacteriia bacterium]